MAAWARFCTSRRHRVCVACHAGIERGQRYQRSTCTPNHDGMGNPRWWTLIHCVGCATRYGYVDPVGAS